jgi:hypothetical protein
MTPSNETNSDTISLLIPAPFGRSCSVRPADGAGLIGEIVEESLRATGAVVMGRRMFSGGEGPWSEDPNADGWWGDNPPFRVPVFVLTHHPRETVVKEGGTTFTFVTDGIESALEQARAAAGDKDVAVSGGADVVQAVLQGRPDRRVRAPRRPGVPR